MISTPIEPALFRGGAILEPAAHGLRPHRLPSWVREQFPDPQLLMVESQPSGIRLSFRSTAQRIELTVHPTRVVYRGADRARGCVDLFVDGEFQARDTLCGGDAVTVDLSDGTTGFVPGTSHVSVFTGLPAPDKRIEIWLPHNETVDLVALRSDAPLVPVHEALPVWMHHGSSISQGSNAAAPSDTWPAVAARFARVDLRNLGFGGSAMAEPFMARVIRDSPADIISVALGINVVNADAMRLRAFVPAVHGFLDTIRDGHPHTPLVLVSPVFTGIHETTPGPGAFDPATIGTDQVGFIATGDPGDVAAGALTLQVIRRELASVVERRSADPHLHYLNGLHLFGSDDASRLPPKDGLHPDGEAHQLIGRRFADTLLRVGGGVPPFAAAYSSS
ncbi:GDSL-type esterase/lipase family protein [Microbacterium sp. 1P10UB]|uniref:GDSL-type esterase/lipase family protein n=1 Tax=unclassified Microbacterium TaxID=2609290 RepID=UPI0039A27DDA